MKVFKKITCLAILMSFVFLHSYAQQNFIQRGEEAFLRQDYTKAANLFLKALDETNERKNAEAYKLIADCNRLMNKFDKAIFYYGKHFEVESNPVDEVFFNYALMLHKTGDIAHAKTIYESLLEKQPDNTEVQRLIASCNFAIIENGKKYLPPIINQELINSEQSEFGLAKMNDKLVFASKRLVNILSSIHGRTNQGFSDLYMATYDPVYSMYVDPIRFPGPINTPYNDGTFAFNPKTNTAFLTQCKKNHEKCQIMTSKLVGDKWENLTPLLFHEAEYSFAHPALSTDLKTLYFVSDIPGGFGGQDIWKATITGYGQIDDIKNLGPRINTPNNEMFPYVANDSILFFASEGHIGMGGLDIFYTKIDGQNFTEPINVGVPLNSAADDFSILLNDDSEGGLFCSNRNNITQSDDIFAFSHNIFDSDVTGIVNDSIKLIPLSEVKVNYYTEGALEKTVFTDETGYFNVPFASHASCGKTHVIELEKDGYVTKQLGVVCKAGDLGYISLWNGEEITNTVTGKATDKNTGDPIPAASVSLKSVKGFSRSVTTNDEGIYSIPNVLSNDYFNIRIEKEGYLTDSRTILVPETTKSLVLSQANGYNTDFELIPIILKTEIKIDNIYYEFDKVTLLDESKVELDKLVNILNENPNITIRINSHTDSRGTDEYNQKLSDNRGKSVVSYLKKQGVEAGRLFSKGYGETQLIIPNAISDAEHQFNRRTTFEIVGTAYNSTIINQGLETEQAIKEKNKDRVAKPVVDKPVQKVIIPKDNKPTGNENINATVGLQIHATSKVVNISVEMDDIKDLIDKYGIVVKEKDGFFKYQLGPFVSRDQALAVKEILIERGYQGIFIVKMDAK